SLLVGDDAADALVEYAALVAQLGSGDSVQLNGIGVDGEKVTASFLLNSGTVLMAESTSSELPEPDNLEATAYMRKQLRTYGTSDAEALAAEYQGPSTEE
ncbi:MAG: hypothetical protein M3116_04805, partial [Actinomycetota bacterium]|nr:hypothetical protein [Actinomycetota bacterium]